MCWFSNRMEHRQFFATESFSLVGGLVWMVYTMRGSSKSDWLWRWRRKMCSCWLGNSSIEYKMKIACHVLFSIRIEPKNQWPKWNGIGGNSRMVVAAAAAASQIELSSTLILWKFLFFNAHASWTVVMNMHGPVPLLHTHSTHTLVFAPSLSTFELENGWYT